MRHRCLSVFAGLLTGLVAVTMGPAPTSAQTSNGVVTGNVVDEQDAGIPGAVVVLTQERTGVEWKTATNSTGSFVFPSVPPDKYAIAVELPGFKRLERAGFVLSSSERLSVGSLKLEVGVTTEVITVTDVAPVVQTTSMERSAVLNEKQMATLSTPGRDYMSMLKLLPGATYPDGTGASRLGNTSPPLINGVRSDYIAINLDGVVANNRGLGTTENTVNLDAVAEVKVLLSNYQAEYGKNGGAMVNVVTKSGTREYHGAAYWYKRHEALNANSFFNNLRGLEKGEYRYDTYGYNLGGPVPLHSLKDKLFFFWSHEVQPATAPSTSTFTVPTERERRGDFSQSFDTNGRLIVIRDPRTGQSFPGNIIPADRIDPNMQRLLNVFPLPNFSDIAISNRNYNYLIQSTNDQPVHQEMLRLDYAPSPSWRLSLRGLAMSVKNDGRTSTANNNTWGIKQAYNTTNPNATMNVTYFASPTVVNELSFGLSRWTEVQEIAPSELAKLQRDQIGFTIGQRNPSINPLNLLPGATFGGIPSPPQLAYDGRFPMDNAVNAFSVADSLSKVWGSHTFKVGAYFEYAVYLQRHLGANFTGVFNFGRSANNPLDSNHPYANALLGNFQTYTERTARAEYQPVNKVLEWYVQDNWRTTRKLTLDYGVRFTYDLPAYQKEDFGGNFDPAAYNRSQQGVLYVPARNAAGTRVAMDPRTGQQFPAAYIGFFVPGSGDPFTGSYKAGDPRYPRGFFNTNGLLFAPRVGFAYDVTGDGKTAVRGGFGVFFNSRARSGQMGDMSGNPPIVTDQQQFYGNVNTFLAASTLQAPSSFSRVMEPNPKMLTFYQMSLGVQRDIGFKTVLDLAYVGNIGKNLGQTRQINAVPYGARFRPENQDRTTNTPLPDNFFRPYFGYVNLPWFEFEGTSSYHSLQAQLKHQFTGGFQFNVAYTWSHALNYGNDYSSGVAQFNDVRFWNYGPSNSDRRHTLSANWLWELPKASRLVDNGVVKLLFDNWQISGIYAYATGLPSEVTMELADAVDLTGGGDGVTVTKIGPADLPRGDRTFNRWFDTSKFVRTARGNVGSGAAASRDAFRLPGLNNFDLTFFKNFPLRGRVALQARWEMYNALNHPTFSDVNSTARFDAAGNQINPQFGQVTAARSARIMQGSVRLSF